MLSGAAEYIFGGFIILISLVIWIAKQWRNSDNKADQVEDDLTAVTKIMKEAEDAAKIRKEAERATRAGNVPNRLHKYQRD